MTAAATRVSRTASAHIAISSAILISSAIVFSSSWQALFSRWRTLSETNSHGFLVLATSVYLVFVTAKRLGSKVSADYHLLSLAALLGLTLLWQLAGMANVLVLQAIFLPLIILLAYVGAAGYSNARSYVFPILFLYFAMPIWGQLVSPLQQMSVMAVSWFLSMFGVPAFIDGEVVHLSSGSFRIESGCSGLHFLIVGLALASLCGHLFLTNVRHKISLVAIAAVFSIVANWVRIAIIVVVGYWSDMQHYLITVDHYYFGWVVFLAALIPPYMAMRRFEKLKPGHTEQELAIDNDTNPAPDWLRRLLVVCCVLCIFPALGFATDLASSSRSNGDIEAPLALGDWTWLEGGSADWSPHYPGAYSEKRGVYRRGQDDIQFYANYYVAQKHGEELISQSSVVVRSPIVFESGPEKLEYSDRNDTNREVLRLVGIDPDDDRQIVIYWYVVGDRRLTRPADVKLKELIARITGTAGSGVVALMMQCRSDCQTEQDKVLAFLARHDNVVGYREDRSGV